MEEVPIKYERHIFVCINERNEGDCCSKKGGMEILRALRDHINKNGLFDRFNITKTKCLGHCEHGPTIAIYPDGKIFRKVSETDVEEIIEKYLSE